MKPKYSVIIPVYNRPEEIDELLGSLVDQTYTNFEVIIVEDGSTIESRSVVERYKERLTVQYFVKPNTGPGPSRNVGFQKAQGDYFVVFDSDCLIPPHYFAVVEDFLASTKADAWGGPDRGHENFTALQQAMAHTMSSLFTTGGIRGATKMIGNYQPRSFNMGISRETFNLTGGFQFDRFAEDIDLSIRMKKAGLAVCLIPEAYVFHKRRSTLTQFFRQVFNFGKGRVLVGNVHPGEAKLVHWFPALFLMGLVFVTPVLLLNNFLGVLILMGYLFYSLLVFGDGLIRTKSFSVALLAIPSLFVQMIGYGTGFLVQKVKS